MTREEAIEIVQAVKFIDDFDDYSDRLEIALDMAIEALKERPHGEWIRNDNGTYSCSICQSWIPNEQHYYARYCLHCGRIMKEGKKNE